MPRLTKPGPRCLELTCAAVAAQNAVYVIVGDLNIASNLFGAGGDAPEHPCVGTPVVLWTVLYTSILMVCSHMITPVRWCLLAFLDGFILVLWSLVFVEGGQQLGFSHRLHAFAGVLLFVWITVLGKRQLERAERSLFQRLLAEQKIRVEAEFALSRLHVAPPQVSLECAASSVPSTTPTGQAFNDLQGCTVQQDAWEPLVQIGRREQWLLGEGEVLLQTGAAALGSGGEGLVIAGTFHGSPVAVKCPKLLRGALHMESVGNELRLLRKCRHQNICQLYGAVIDPSHGDLALVMERVVGVCMYSFILGNRRMANTVQLRKHGSSALMESAVRLCICTHGGHG